MTRTFSVVEPERAGERCRARCAAPEPVHTAARRPCPCPAPPPRRGLHRHRGEALIDEPTAHDDVGVGEHVVLPRRAAGRRPRSCPCQETAAARRRRTSRLEVDDDVERLEVDLDELGGIDGLLAGLRHDDRDRPRPGSARARPQGSAAALSSGAIGPGGRGPSSRSAAVYAPTTPGAPSAACVSTLDGESAWATSARTKTACSASGQPDVVGVHARALDERRVFQAPDGRAVFAVDRSVSAGHGRASYRVKVWKGP